MAASFRSPSKVARRLKLTPLVSTALQNWPSFMYNYALGLTPRAPYRFRNGARLQIGRGVDHVPIIEIFLRHDYGEIPDDAVIVDLGASIGVFSIYAATTARDVRLYAYEPMPEAFELMQLNVRLNGLENAVTCFNLAVARDSAVRELFAPEGALHFPTLVPPRRAGRAVSAKVQCTTLASILDSNSFARVDLLKMDIEGAEYETLYGTAPGYFERIREIRMEYHDLDVDRRNARRLKDFLISQRYRITREQGISTTNGNLWAEHA
jgi:FkbM family methyltransferase